MFILSLIDNRVALPSRFVLLNYFFDIHVPLWVFLDVIAHIPYGLFQILVDYLNFDSRLRFGLALELAVVFLREVRSID